MNDEKIIRKPDYDLEYCAQNDCSINPQNIKNVLAQVPGEADTSNWHWIVEMNDGKFLYITGGCDYSGWGCQDWGEAKEATTAQKAAKLANPDTWQDTKKPIRQQLLDQLKGKQPYGLREE